MSSPHRILHVIDALDGYGSSKQLQLLVDHQRQGDCQVVVVALWADRRIVQNWQAEGIDCHVLDRRWSLDPISLGRMASIFWRNQFDLIHAWNQDAIDYVQLTNKSRATPWIGTLFSSSPGSLPARFRLREPLALVTSIPSARSTHVISPAIRSLTHDSDFHNDFLQEQDLEQDSPLIAVAGELIREKRIEEAIWTFELIRIIDDRVRLLIFGDGADRARLERFARLASESSAIRFLGYRDDFCKCLPFIDVFWYAGVNVGNINMSVIEAMASEVPIVVTDTIESRTFIEQGNNGFLVPLDHRALRARHTLQLLEDQELASRIGRAGAESAQNQLSYSKMVETYDVLYEDVLQGKSAEKIELLTV